MSKSTIAFRLLPSELAALDQIAAKRGCSRSEAARYALMFGIRFAEADHSFNITRAVLVLEYMQAAIDVIITRDHGDVVPQLLAAAKQRLETFHA
ncbi:MAG: ribbon-helix-helix protein, CopG family [Cupriavidus sp.]|uniref:Ribbon-helix-helix protein, CopG family n=1 Tax=Sphingobium yanoikuyae TaxID=13690 RepID=A0A3G2UMI6_SPHYA|nr:ribbon-helix-helix protein, CopG family [Sphingobium yanoikuyae]MBU64741.1 ribbon-helix-helix protein, CopG family [Cupriavidus sp.]PHP20755.1 ribbon-helix-helix protein, CopG family [Sphingobium sp. IP1]PZU05727.1 MAG: ribbon-helix-helix protein, CopG family [Sphingobium sp.]PZU77944.1 MAG: ribbon-helix-helix protein, CopG family [Rhizobium sp.]RSU72975.1 ribbon-helix-helix protein, CopG family [Sphingomonas sp. S-NIH.Pt3_0716]